MLTVNGHCKVPVKKQLYINKVNFLSDFIWYKANEANLWSFTCHFNTSLNHFINLYKSSFIDTLPYPLTFSSWKRRLISFIYELNFFQVLTSFSCLPFCAILAVTFSSMGYSIQTPFHPKDSNNHGEVQ